MKLCCLEDKILAEERDRIIQYIGLQE